MDWPPTFLPLHPRFSSVIADIEKSSVTFIYSSSSRQQMGLRRRIEERMRFSKRQLATLDQLEENVTHRYRISEITPSKMTLLSWATSKFGPWSIYDLDASMMSSSPARTTSVTTAIKDNFFISTNKLFLLSTYRTK